MSEARDYLGTIASKKLDNTGITEDHLRGLQTPGQHRLVLMEVVTDEVANTQGGQKKVKLKAGIVEMVPREQEDTVREFMRAIADSRGGDATIPGTEGQNLDQTAKALAAQIDRDEDGKPTGKGIWDGDPDAPLTPPEDEADEPGAVCDYPGCTLPEEHDGDHNVEPDQEEPTGGTVAQFSSRARG